MVAEGRTLVVPDVQSLAIDVAKEMLDARGFSVEVRGSGPTVGGQSPRPGTVVTPGTTIRLAAQGGEKTIGLAEVPDLRGMPIRRAINMLTVHDLEASVRGSGVVRGQSPGPGQRVKPGTRVALQCEGRGKFLGVN